MPLPQTGSIRIRGSIETLYPSGSGANFNYVSFAQEDVENTYFSSRLRIEKMDAETGETIFHDGALFRIYAAKRDVKRQEPARQEEADRSSSVRLWMQRESR